MDRKDQEDTENQPVTESFVLHEAVPTWFVTSSLYSPASVLSVERIFRVATFLVKDMSYLAPAESSLLSLNHLVFSSGEPETVTSRAVFSPDFTLRDAGLSTTAAGSRNQEEVMRLQELFYTQFG